MPSEVLRQVLIDLGQVEGITGWTCYTSFLPETPPAAVCIYDTAGVLDGRLMETGEQVVHPGFQIRVRNTDPVVAWNYLNRMVSALDQVKMREVAMSSEEYWLLWSVSRTGDLLPAGIEEQGGKRMFHYTANGVMVLARKE
jgi:hypothetical protein